MITNTNTKIANALDRAVDYIERKIPTEHWWTEFTCIHVERMERDGEISEAVATATKDAIADSIQFNGTFNGYYADIHGERAARDLDAVLTARIEHMRALANEIRNR